MTIRIDWHRSMMTFLQEIAHGDAPMENHSELTWFGGRSTSCSTFQRLLYAYRRRPALQHTMASGIVSWCSRHANQSERCCDSVPNNRSSCTQHKPCAINPFRMISLLLSLPSGLSRKGTLVQIKYMSLFEILIVLF